MAQQPAANESTSSSSPDTLHPIMEQQVEGPDHSIISTSPGSNSNIQPNVEDAILSSSTSPCLSTMTLVDHQDKSMPFLLSASQNSTMEQQHEGREPDHRATLNPPRVEDASTEPFLSGLMQLDTEQQYEHSPSLLPSPGEPSPNTQLSVRNHSASNISAQQVEIKQQQPRHFLLSGPMQSSIMLRRNARPESAAAGRSSTSQESMQNLNPLRVKKLISTLGFDDQQSEKFFKIVIATAPFHNTKSLLTPPAPEESKPQANAFLDAFGKIRFSLKPPTATAAGKGFLASNGTVNPTGNLLFDAKAAETLGSRPIGPRSDSPPLLWSTAAVEESLDPDAEDPTYFTVAEFINTINEKRIQVESVTEEDWLIEEMRVAILNRLQNDISEGNPIMEENSDEVSVSKEKAAEEVKVQEDSFKSDLTADGDPDEILVTKQDTPKADLQRWNEQGPDGWLKRDDGTDMNEQEIDEECARWDAMVREARKEKEAERAAALLGKNVMQKEQTKDSISAHGEDEKASVSTHDQDEKASQKKGKKGSRKNKNKNRKAKKKASKGGDPEDASDDVPDTGKLSDFLNLPTLVRKKVLGFVLVVDQELVPYRYVKGEILKNVGLRKKPELNILLALCSSKDQKVKKCLDDAKNVLYRDNTFSIQKPNELIMFLGTIGGDNVTRMKMGKNLLLDDGFFHKKRQYELEMKWLAHWGKDLLFAMKGYNIFRSDVAAESSEDGLTCEPTDIEKALKSMVEVMKDESKMSKMLKENSDGLGSDSSPMRLQSLDLGEKFDSLAERIKTMGLVAGDSEVAIDDTAKMPEEVALEKAVESMSEKWKRKAQEIERTAKDEGEAYGERFLNAVTAQDEEHEEDIDSGIYTPSVYSEHGKQPISSANYSIDMIR